MRLRAFIALPLCLLPWLGLGQGFHPEPLSSAERAHPSTHIDPKATTFADRCAFYRSRLGRFVDEINAAARYQDLPPRLVATVVLNEMAHILIDDVAQDQQLLRTQGRPVLDQPVFWFKNVELQSFGIAQITPRTAKKYQAVAWPEGAGLNEEELYFFIAYRLLDRRISIQAAARLIRVILNRMQDWTHRPFMQDFLQEGWAFDPDAPYDAVKPARNPNNLRQSYLYKETRLAQAVASVYNSDSIYRMTRSEVDDQRHYNEAKKHGWNAAIIAEDLYSGGCGLQLDPWPYRQSKLPRFDTQVSTLDSDSAWSSGKGYIVYASHDTICCRAGASERCYTEGQLPRIVMIAKPRDYDSHMGDLLTKQVFASRDDAKRWICKHDIQPVAYNVTRNIACIGGVFVARLPCSTP